MFLTNDLSVFQFVSFCRSCWYLYFIVLIKYKSTHKHLINFVAFCVHRYCENLKHAVVEISIIKRKSRVLNLLIILNKAYIIYKTVFGANKKKKKKKENGEYEDICQPNPPNHLESR